MFFVQNLFSRFLPHCWAKKHPLKADGIDNGTGISNKDRR
jgi:hypothetical protein